MTFLVVALLGAAAVALGLRLTSGLLSRLSHPIDRLLLALVVGISITGLSLVVSMRYRVFELGLGLLVSLAPVGLYDLLCWWGRSRRCPPGPWLSGPLWSIVARCLVAAGLALASAGAVAAVAGVIR